MANRSANILLAIISPTSGASSSPLAALRTSSPSPVFGADHEVEVPRWRVLELDGDAILLIVESPHAIAEHGFHSGCYSFEDVPRQIAAKDAEQAIA
jgi:hypothetical protein